MTLIPVVCDTCGTVWGQPNIFVGVSAKNLKLTGSKVTGCPKCEGTGSIPDGVYDIQDDVLQVVESANMEADTLQGLIGLLESLKRGEKTEAEVIQRAESDTPDLVPVLQKIFAKGDLKKVWLPILISMLLWYFPAPGSSPPTAGEIATELRADNVPGLVAPDAPAARPAKLTRRKRPPKAHGKVKQRKSRKRR